MSQGNTGTIPNHPNFSCRRGHSVAGWSLLICTMDHAQTPPIGWIGMRHLLQTVTNQEQQCVSCVSFFFFSFFHLVSFMCPYLSIWCANFHHLALTKAACTLVIFCLTKETAAWWLEVDCTNLQWFSFQLLSFWAQKYCLHSANFKFTICVKVQELPETSWPFRAYS